MTSEELKEILRFRRLARYASMLQGVGLFGLKVPMPKVPHVIEELVSISRQQQQQSSPRSMDSTRSSGNFTMDTIALPQPQEDHDGSPRFDARRKSGNLSVTTLDEMYVKHSGSTDQFEFTNPTMLPKHSPKGSFVSVSAASTPTDGHDEKKRLSSSQKAAMQNVGKVLRLDSPRVGHAVHKSRSRKSRARKRIAAHSILQPWFVVLYFFLPLFLLSSIYLVPFMRDLYTAWKDQKAIKTVIEVPWVLERLLKVPDFPLLKSTVYIGLFAVEMTGIVYLSLLVMSQLTIFLVVRPLLLSLSTSFSDRGAAMD